VSTKEISILIRAKNAMAAGLSSAGRSLQAFGSSVLRIGKFFVKAFLGAGAAVVGFATKAIAAYAVQEAAERSLAAAMTAHGEAGKAILPALNKIAAAIQDETGASDESTLAGMAKMRMLGVQTSKLGEAAKAVVALKGLGLEEAAAQKAVAMAMQGSYDMLNRYVPALRSATSEEEKARIVNELFANGYEQQAAILDTVSGQWRLLKGRVGDLWEVIGGAIVQNDTLMLGIKRAGEAVKEFGNKIALWVEGGGIVRLIAGFKIFYADVSHTFKLIGNSAHIAWAAIGDGVETLVRANIAQFAYMGAYIAAIWKKIKSPTSAFEAPKLGDHFGITTKRTVAALAEREKINEEYAERIEDIAKEQADAQIKHEDRVVKAKKAAAEAEKKMAETTTTVVERESKKQAQARLARLKQELSELNRKKALWENLAKSRVQAFLDEQKAKKEEDKSVAKDDAKAKRLADNEARGARLGGAQKRWLDAYNKIKNAKDIFANLKDAGKTLEGQIEMATVQLDNTSKGYLKNISDNINEALQYPE